MNNDDFVTAIFDEGEKTCLAYNPYGTTVYDVKAATTWEKDVQPEYFSINPLKNSRLDDNCTAHRNFLVEIDKVSLPKQVEIVKKLGIPYTTWVYSGGKSYHWVVSVNGILDRQDYDHFVHRLFSVIPEIDQANKNPSRLSRYPGTYRKSKEKEQTLIDVRQRLTVEQFDAWLTSKGAGDNPYDYFREMRKLRDQERRYLVELEVGTPEMRRSTERFLTEGVQEGGRNQALFKAACDLFELGLSFDDAVLELEKAPVVLTPKEFQRTIESAQKMVSRKSGV